MTAKSTSSLRIALSLLLVGMGLSLSACNTTEGAGKDIKATGNAIEHSAQDNKPQ